MDASELKSINDSIEKWDAINDSQRLAVIRKIKEFAVIEKTAIPKDTEIACPRYKYPISGPCNLKTCQHYIDHSKSFNCVYHSLDQSKKKRLTTNEAAQCMGLTVSQINSLVNSGIQKIRIVKIEDDIETTRPNRFNYLSGHCANCGLNIADELDLGSSPQLIIEHGVMGYCSDACKKEKAPWKVRLERRYGTDWEYVVIKGAEYLGSIKASGKDVEGLLGVDPSSLNSKDKASISKYREMYHLDS